MAEQAPAGMPAVPPPIAILQMIGGYWMARMLYVVPDLGMAELIDERPRPAAELAAATGVHPRALSRVLRALAGVGCGGSGRVICTSRIQPYTHYPNRRPGQHYRSRSGLIDNFKLTLRRAR